MNRLLIVAGLLTLATVVILFVVPATHMAAVVSARSQAEECKRTYGCSNAAPDDPRYRHNIGLKQ